MKIILLTISAAAAALALSACSGRDEQTPEAAMPAEDAYAPAPAPAAGADGSMTTGNDMSGAATPGAAGATGTVQEDTGVDGQPPSSGANGGSAPPTTGGATSSPQP